MSNATTPVGISTIEIDGSALKPKRRLSDGKLRLLPVLRLQEGNGQAENLPILACFKQMNKPIASDDSNTASKSKKLIGADGKLVKDGSNKTKSGRFKRTFFPSRLRLVNRALPLVVVLLAAPALVCDGLYKSSFADGLRFTLCRDVELFVATTSRLFIPLSLSLRPDPLPLDIYNTRQQLEHPLI